MVTKNQQAKAVDQAMENAGGLARSIENSTEKPLKPTPKPSNRGTSGAEKGEDFSRLEAEQRQEEKQAEIQSLIPTAKDKFNESETLGRLGNLKGASGGIAIGEGNEPSEARQGEVKFTGEYGSSPDVSPPTVQFEGESEHVPLNLLRAQLSQIVSANPPNSNSGIYGKNDLEKQQLIPFAMSLINILRKMKEISPDVNVRDELAAIESPSGYPDGESYLQLIEDGVLTDGLKDALYSMHSHVPESADEAIHDARIYEKPVVKVMNEASAVLEKSDSAYGDNYQEFVSAEDVLKAHPKLDRGKLDEYYGVASGKFRVPVNIDASGQIVDPEPTHTGKTGLDERHDILTDKDDLKEEKWDINDSDYDIGTGTHRKKSKESKRSSELKRLQCRQAIANERLKLIETRNAVKRVEEAARRMK